MVQTDDWADIFWFCFLMVYFPLISLLFVYLLFYLVTALATHNSWIFVKVSFEVTGMQLCVFSNLGITWKCCYVLWCCRVFDRNPISIYLPCRLMKSQPFVQILPYCLEILPVTLMMGSVRNYANRLFSSWTLKKLLWLYALSYWYNCFLIILTK